MKQTLIALSLGVLFASCIGGGDQTVALQKQVDSLTKLVPPGTVGIQTSQLHSAPGQNGPFQSMDIGAYYMPKTLATELIENYHSLFEGNDNAHQDAKIPSNNLNRTSFVIPASTLKELIDGNKSGCEYVIFYLGYDKDAKHIDLIYTGVVPDTSDPTKFTEISFPNPNDPNQQVVFDNAWPCPTCDGIGIHSKTGLMYSAIFPSVGDGGTITPSGDIINVPYGHDTSFTIKPNNNYVIDKIKINGVDSPIVNPFPIKKVKSVVNLSVTFKLASK